MQNRPRWGLPCGILAHKKPDFTRPWGTDDSFNSFLRSEQGISANIIERNSLSLRSTARLSKSQKDALPFLLLHADHDARAYLENTVLALGPFTPLPEFIYIRGVPLLPPRKITVFKKKQENTNGRDMLHYFLFLYFLIPIPPGPLISQHG